MAPLSSAFFTFSLLLLFILLVQCTPSPKPSSAFHTIDIHTLMPQNVCSSSKDPRGSSGANLTIFHLYGPCSPLHGQQNLDLEKILRRDEARIKYLNRRLRGDRLDTSGIPVHTDFSLGSGSYFVTIGFGSPKKEQSVVFDTGSDLTWIQCKPCESCYQQQQPIFDPSQSSTYTNISSPYYIQYFDGSYSQGFWTEDTLTLSPSDVLQKFRFGCGHRNGGIFGQSVGILGLGHEMKSIVSQSFQRYGGIFAYCLPSTSSSPGYLTFGGDPSSPPFLKTTPMLTRPNAPAIYFLELVAIRIAGQRLSIPSKVFSNAGTIIDSGIVITKLPPQAYSALRSAFRKAMSSYKLAPAYKNLDTCYDLTGHARVTWPAVALQFGGRITIGLDASGIVYPISLSQTCLAFASTGDASRAGSIGTWQQKTFHIVYDISKKVIGFGHNRC